MRVKELSSEYLPAVASGVLLALAFPSASLAPLAWFALVPLFCSLEERPFRKGFVTGLVFFAAVLYWLNIVMVTYGGLNLVFSIVAYLLLVAYLALYVGAVTAAAMHLARRLGWSPLWTLPLAWAAGEYLRAHLLSGFPWASLGYSQYALLPLVQSADLWGVYGLSLLLVFSNAVLARLWKEAPERRWRGSCLAGLLVLAGLFVANLGYGYLRLDQAAETDREQLRIALIQGNIDQSVKWNPDHLARTLRTYLDLSRQAIAPQPVDLLVWPESATPFFYQDGGPAARLVDDLAVASGSYLLFGSPAYQREEGRTSYLNSAFLLSPQGRPLGRSDKVHLVPFGEYVPLKWLLPFVDKLVVGIGDFSPGTVSPLAMNGHQLGVLVCYEAIFPDLARDYVRQGADLLVNITNDAWFGRSSAPWQHLEMACFRAIENRVWLARAANTGVSALVDPTGKIRRESGLFEATQISGLAGYGARPGIYGRFGDVLPMLGLLVIGGGLLLTLVRQKSK